MCLFRGEFLGFSCAFVTETPGTSLGIDASVESINEMGHEAVDSMTYDYSVFS